MSIGLHISFLQAFIISLIGIFSLILNITPANLGVQELVIGFASEYLLIDGGAEGLLAALVVRAATIILVFSLGPLFSFILARDYGENITKELAEK